MRDYQTKANVGGGADSIVSTKFGAGEFNSIAQELENSVSRSGLTLANSAGTSEDVTQLSQSLFINGVAASSVQDNGAADAIVLTPLTGTNGFKLPPSYASLDGAQFSFFPAFANATTTPTVSIGQTTGTQLGAKTIVSESGGALVAGDIDPNILAIIRYDLGNDEFRLVKKAAEVTDFASQAQMETATATDVAVSPGVQRYHPAHPKAWINFNGTGTAAIREDYGVASITDNGTGNYTVTFDVAFSNTNYACADGSTRTIGVNNDQESMTVISQSTTAFRTQWNDPVPGASDQELIMLVFTGDQ